MNYSQKNANTLAAMQSINSALSDLKIEGDDLIYNGQRVNISKFDINLLMGDALPFESQLTTLTPNDVYKIISLHAITLASKTPALTSNKNEAELEALKQKNPRLNNIVITTRELPNGSKQEYINIVDSEGKDHLLYNMYNVDLMQMYMEALTKFGSSDITPEQLFEVFRERCTEVDLEDTYDMAHRSGTSEEFRTKMEDYEKKHQDDKHYALGNEENNILISNDHTVTSYERDKEGNLVQKDFGNSAIRDGELNTGDNATTTSAGTGGNSEPTPPEPTPTAPATPSAEEGLNVNEQDAAVALKEEARVIKLISQEEFYRLISSSVDLTEEELKQVQLFNSYLEDLMVYRDYLLPELREILAKFEYVMAQYATANEEELNQNQQTELNKYYEMQDNIEKRVLKSDNVNLENEVQKLKLVMPEKEGKTNSVAIILIMSALVIIMGIVAVVIGR